MWKEVDILEKSIILVLKKNHSSVTEIAKEVKRAKPTISKTVERMQNQDLIKKSHNYTKDARKIEISINPKRIKIEKSHTFFLTYYILISISLIISGVISLILKNPYLIIGSVIVALPLIFLMIYQIYVMEDKVIVYKNPQIIKKELNKESIKEPESS